MYIYNTSYLIGGVKFITHEVSDDAGLANRLITQEHQLVFFPMYKKKKNTSLYFARAKTGAINEYYETHTQILIGYQILPLVYK